MPEVTIVMAAATSTTGGGAGGMSTALWLVAALTLLYAAYRLAPPGARPAALLRAFADEGWKVAAVGAAVGIIVGGLSWLSAMGGSVGSLAETAVLAVTGGMVFLFALFLARQFHAPPWWRLNAWNPDGYDHGYSGSLPDIARWIIKDAARLLHALRPVDRAAVLLGGPAIGWCVAQVVGAQTMLVGALALLLVLYVALGVALVTANRIPRVLMSRLQELRKVSRSIAEGDLNARVAISDMGEYEELGELIRDINSMARSLEAREIENQTLHNRLRTTLAHEQERATRDPLTGLRNHGYFHDSLAAELDRCGRTGRIVTIGIIDLDNFKQVNDRFGHQEGDAVLVRVTHAIAQSLRPYDLPCRMGGEEFGIIFPETSPEEAKAVLDRIAIAVRGCGPNGEVATFSGGVACFPAHATDQVTLYQLADEAAYTAKSRGKNQTVIYDPVAVQSMDASERVDQRERDAIMATVRALARSVDERESLGRSHSEHVSEFSAAIATGLGFDDEFISQVRLCGLLHDVGKIGVPDAVVGKTGRLSEDEYEQMKRHPELSSQILRSAGLEEVAAWVLRHHEAWDGSGYPDRLEGESIPIASRIVAVAEAFETMTSDRPYRRAATPDQAVAELRAYSGRMFDPRVVEMLALLVERDLINSAASVRAAMTEPVAAEPGPAAHGGQLQQVHPDPYGQVQAAVPDAQATTTAHDDPSDMPLQWSGLLGGAPQGAHGAAGHHGYDAGAPHDQAARHDATAAVHGLHDDVAAMHWHDDPAAGSAAQLFEHGAFGQPMAWGAAPPSGMHDWLLPPDAGHPSSHDDHGREAA